MSAPFSGTALRAQRPRRRARQRSGEHVRDNSRWDALLPNAPIDHRTRRRRLSALRKEAKETRQPGRRRGHGPLEQGQLGNLGWIGERIYAYLLDLLERFGGAVFPPAAKIAEDVGCDVKTVHRAKRVLKARGWLDWTHRCVKTEHFGRKEKGPQVRQISNWYHLRVPAWAQKLIDIWARRDEEAAGDDAWQARRWAARRQREEWEAQALVIAEVDRAEKKEAFRKRLDAAVHAVRPGARMDLG
jgi:hypothetical protein